MVEWRREGRILSTGIPPLDELLGGVQPGDNILWRDLTGSLAGPFVRSFLHSAIETGRHAIYVSFDHSPRELIHQLEEFARGAHLTIIDCFTWGLGDGADEYLDFYLEERRDYPCRILRVDQPREIDPFREKIAGACDRAPVPSSLIFDSLGGAQRLFKDDDGLSAFVSEQSFTMLGRGAVAYWLSPGEQLSPLLRKCFSEAAQAVIELSLRRGRMYLALRQAHESSAGVLRKPIPFSVVDGEVALDEQARLPGHIELGRRVKQARKSKRLNQTELAKLVGVSAGTISQIEGNAICPSLPILLRIAEVLEVQPDFFLRRETETEKRLIVDLADSPTIELRTKEGKRAVVGCLSRGFADWPVEMYVIEFPPDCDLGSHFFMEKSAEMGYLISGELRFRCGDREHVLRQGGAVFLKTEIPDYWRNPDMRSARLLWIRLK